VLALAGCGGGGGSTENASTETTGTTTTGTTTSETTKLRVYFLREGKVQPVAREVPKTQAVAGAALGALAKGPTKAESELDLTSEVSADISGVSIENGVAKPEGVIDVSRSGLAQIVYTLTQFTSVEQVEINGKQYTRADFEDETPIILVESPLPLETVNNPLRARGTANTFEATFQYEVVDPDGKVVDSGFVTATSGSGQRGTFDFTTKPFTVARAGLGALVVYEVSAKDGSRIHQVEIPVHLVKS
jgi:germination protein M